MPRKAKPAPCPPDLARALAEGCVYIDADDVLFLLRSANRALALVRPHLPGILAAQETAVRATTDRILRRAADIADTDPRLRLVIAERLMAVLALCASGERSALSAVESVDSKIQEHPARRLRDLVHSVAMFLYPDLLDAILRTIASRRSGVDLTHKAGATSDPQASKAATVAIGNLLIDLSGGTPSRTPEGRTLRDKMRSTLSEFWKALRRANPLEGPTERDRRLRGAARERRRGLAPSDPERERPVPAPGEVRLGSHDPASPEDGDHLMALAAEDLTLWDRIMETLPRDEAEAVVAVYRDRRGETKEMIAHRLGCTDRTLRNRLDRAMSRLRWIFRDLK